jgi:hypothetical protein
MRSRRSIGINSGSDEMPGPSSQSPRDRILWILNSHGGSIELGKLRGKTGIRYAILTPAILLLKKEGRIKIEEKILTLLK